MNDPKSGYKTTEFWLSLLAQVVGILVLLGYLSPEQAEAAQSSGANIIQAIFGLILAVAPAVGYAISRGWVKASFIKAKK